MTTSSRKPVFSLSAKVAKAEKAKAEKQAALDAAVAAEALRQAPVVILLRARVSPELKARVEASAASASADDAELGMPLAAYTKEATQLALFVEKYGAPHAPYSVSLAPYAAKIGPEVALELVYLVEQVDVAEDVAGQANVARDDNEVARARFVLREIRLALGVLVDDDARDDRHAALEGLRREHGTDLGTHAELASALGAYARLGRKWRALLHEVPDFDPALLAEGEKLQGALRARRTASDQDDAVKAARATRNRYLDLIRVRIAKIRKIARYVFRAHPEVLREVTSAYARDKRRALRRSDPGPAPAPLPDVKGAAE